MLVEIGDRLYPAIAGIPRSDVADFFDVPAYDASGYTLSLPADAVPPGPFTLRIVVVSPDGTTLARGPRKELVLDPG